MLDRNKLIQKVAIEYYYNKLTYIEIANLLNISRQTVSKLLKEGEEKGIIRITVQDSNWSSNNKVKIIKDTYNLQNVYIADPVIEVDNKQLVGELCANFIESNLTKYRSIGLGWGTTIYEFVKAASFMSDPVNLKIIPLMGGIGINDVNYHSNHLSFELAEKYNCDVEYFYAPTIAENKEVYDIFINLPLVKRTMTNAMKVDMAIIAVGNPIKSSTYRLLRYINEDERKEIQKSNAIGDILSTFFDKKGHPVETSVSNRMIGLKLSEIEMLKEVCIVSAGYEKAKNIEVLLHKNFIDHLIIDNQIANELLKNIKPF